jgi:hypothetical protein
MHLTRTAAALLIVLARSFAGPLAAQDIALDALHGHEMGVDPATSAVLAEFRAELQALGFTLHARSVFGPSELQGMEAVFLMQPFLERYTDGEIAALASFAAAGGGVVILACGGGDSDALTFNLNALAAPFGCSFQGSAVAPDGTRIGPLTAHAITQGLDSFGLDFHRPLATIGAPATDLTVLGGAQDALAVAESFRGGHDVVLLASVTAFFESGSQADQDLGSPGNRQLLRNVAVNATSGHDDFVLMPFVPGVAGQANTVRVFEAVPGRRVYFVGGTQPGSAALPFCGLVLGIQAPLLLGSAVADGTGTASLSLQVPPGLAGVSVYTQALQASPCGLSNRLKATF